MARMAGEQMIEVEPARVANDERPIGWRFASGHVIAVPRRDLEQFEAAKARLRLPATGRARSPDGERDAVTLANAQAPPRGRALFWLD